MFVNLMIIYSISLNVLNIHGLWIARLTLFSTYTTILLIMNFNSRQIILCVKMQACFAVLPYDNVDVSMRA